MKTAKGMFEVTAWDERTYQELEGGGKLSEAKVTQKFSGDIVGEGSVIWLMCYTSPKSARFVGIQRVVGAIAGHEGSFVMRTDGAFDGQTARWTAEVIDGSATGRLSGLSGGGTFEAPHGSKATFSIEYELGEAKV